MIQLTENLINDTREHLAKTCEEIGLTGYAERHRKGLCDGTFAAVAVRALLMEIHRLQQHEMAAFGASGAACYLYPGEDQQNERAAFCAGASHAIGVRRPLDLDKPLVDPVKEMERDIDNAYWDYKLGLTRSIAEHLHVLGYRKTGELS
jgi:hypothetical protein